MDNAEVLEGYIVDIACLRKYPQQEMLQRARSHHRSCTLMGHCVESGFGLVNEDGIHLLDPHATPLVFKAVSASTKDCGIWLRVRRESGQGEMRTVDAGECAEEKSGGG